MATIPSQNRPEAGNENLPTIHWDDSRMASSYANVVNVTGTREEITLLFGTNQTWRSGQDVNIQLNNRIIVSPYAAKRLSVLLERALAEYESRYGELKVEAAPPINT